jgi:hypothetical protein
MLTKVVPNLPKEPDSVPAPLTEPRIRAGVPIPLTSLEVEETETETMPYRSQPEEIDQGRRAVE